MDAAEEELHIKSVKGFLRKDVNKNKLLRFRLRGDDLFWKANMDKRAVLLKAMEEDNAFLMQLCTKHPNVLKSTLQAALHEFIAESQFSEVPEPPLGWSEWCRQQAYAVKQEMIEIRKLSGNVKDGSRTPKFLLALVAAFKKSIEAESPAKGKLLRRRTLSEAPPASTEKALRSSSCKASDEGSVQIEFLERSSFKTMHTKSFAVERLAVLGRRSEVMSTSFCYMTPKRRALSPISNTVEKDVVTLPPTAGASPLTAGASYYDDFTGTMARLLPCGAVEHCVKFVAGDAGFCVATWEDGAEERTEIPNVALDDTAASQAKGKGKSNRKKKSEEKNEEQPAKPKKSKGKGKKKKAKKNKKKKNQDENKDSNEVEDKKVAPVARRRLCVKTLDTAMPKKQDKKATTIEDAAGGWKLVTKYRGTGESYNEYINPSGVRLRALREATAQGFINERI